jgi:hypothetical protein
MERSCSCAEAQILSAEACMILSNGPIFGRFIHFFVSAPKLCDLEGKLAGGWPLFSAGRGYCRAGIGFQSKMFLQITNQKRLTANALLAPIEMASSFRCDRAQQQLATCF